MILKDYKALIDKAIDARNHSYSPYSHFRVGSAILCDSGSIYTGCNVENASYGETVCAERIAIFNAILFRNSVNSCVLIGLENFNDSVSE